MSLNNSNSHFGLILLTGWLIDSSQAPFLRTVPFLSARACSRFPGRDLSRPTSARQVAPETKRAEPRALKTPLSDTKRKVLKVT